MLSLISITSVQMDGCFRNAKGAFMCIALENCEIVCCWDSKSGSHFLMRLIKTVYQTQVFEYLFALFLYCGL